MTTIPCLYLKYKEDRCIARSLNTPTSHKKPKESKKNDDRVANKSENQQKKTPSCIVSLPIEAFHNYLRKRAASQMADEDIRLKKMPKLTDVKNCPGLIRRSPEALKSKTAQLQMVRPNKAIVPVSESRPVPGPSESPFVPSNLLINQETKNITDNPPHTQPASLDELIFKVPQSIPPRKKFLLVSESRSVPNTGELPIAPLNLHLNKETKNTSPNSSETLKLRMVRPQNKIIIPVSEGRSLPGSGKLPIITSNILISKETKNMEKNPPLTKHNCLNASTMIPPENISFKHKLPVSAVPGTIIPNMGTSTTDAKPKLGAMESSTPDANKCIKRRAETFVQTENVFCITEDDSKTLDLLTSNGVTREELTKWLDKRRKRNNKMTTEVIIDVDKDDENKNINQDTLNLALFHSQNNKNKLLSEMAQLNKSKASQSPNTARPTQLQNLMEAKKSIIQMAFEKFALNNHKDPPAMTTDRNTQTEEITDVTQSDLFHREHHCNNLQQLVTMPNQQTQYDPQAVLMQKEQLKQQRLQSAHQQSYLQMQPRMQLQQTEHQQRFQLSQSEHQHCLQLQQPEHQQCVQPQTPQMQQHLQLQSSQLQRLQSQNQLQQSLHLQQPQMQRHSLQHQSPLQFLEHNQNVDQLQSSHNGEHQNEFFQQQQIQPTQVPPNMQYAPAANYRNHSKPPASKAMRQLFPGDPRCKTLRYQLAASKQTAHVMSTYEANMRTAQQTHQNYQQQYQQHYQNQYW